MPRIFDFHTHAFPDRIRLTARIPALEELRKKARTWLRPLSHSLHRSQPFLRILPEAFRRPVEEVAALAPLPGLLLESTPQDLREAMTAAEIDRALVIAHPPFLTNEELLEICKDDPKLIPAVNIPPGTDRPGETLRRFVKRGARVLKIHAPADGEGNESSRYRALLKTAADEGLPVVLHTGCIHSHLLYRKPELGDARSFAPWFKNYPSIAFVLAHMNYHDPEIAMELAEEHPNVRVDTSWQPCEVIGEAVRRVGAEKVLFGTDWPLIGDNIRVGIQRIQDCVETGTISIQEAQKILGKNAECLLNLPN